MTTSIHNLLNMRICIIGSGNLATTWAIVLKKAGNDIVQIWSRTIEHATALADQVGADATDDMKQLNRTAEIYILAVSDDGLAPISKQITMTDQIVIHTSGCSPMEVLDNTSKNIGAVWSPQSFVKGHDIQFDIVPFCIEANNDFTRSKLRHLFSGISTQIYDMDSRQRQWAHLTAVMINNFGNALNAAAQTLSKQQQIDFTIFHPIILQTAQKALSDNIAAQQTGPAVRNDQTTLQQHRTLLGNCPDLLQLYNLFTKIIQNGTH